MTFFFDFHPPIFSGINHDQINHDLRARLVVMPDWLRAQAPWQGAADEGDDEEQAAEKDWLSSSLRLLTEDSEGVGVKKPAETYRTATQWWLIMIDTFLYIRTSASLEAFSSPDTPPVVSSQLRQAHMRRREKIAQASRISNIVSMRPNLAPQKESQKSLSGSRCP